MKKIVLLTSLAMMCGMLQGCSLEQKIELNEGVEATLLTVGVPKDSINNGKFKSEYEGIDFLLEVENKSESIFDIDEDVLEEKITPVNQNGEIDADMQIIYPSGLSIKPKQKGDIIVSLTTSDDSESIGLKVGEQKLLVSPNDDKIQIYDFDKVEINRNSVTYESDDMSITFNANPQDNTDISSDERCAECNYTIENKTDRPLIIPEISIETATNYTYGGNVSGPDWIGSDWQYSSNGADELMKYIDESVEADSANEKNKEEKEKIISQYDILGYLREGQNLSKDEVTDLVNTLEKNDIFLDSDTTVVVYQERLEPKEKISEKDLLVINAIGNIVKTNLNF